MSTVLQVESINVYYGSIHAVKDVSFHVEQGEVCLLYTSSAFPADRAGSGRCCSYVSPFKGHRERRCRSLFVYSAGGLHSGERIVHPVSYTHLDVYKRQT